MPRCRRLQIWTDLEAAGGSALAEIPDLLDLADRRNTRDDQQLTCTLPLVSPAYASLLEKRVLRQIFTDGSVDEWRITEIDEARPQAGQLIVPVTADWPSLDLGEKCLISRTEADGSVSYDFDVVGLTPSQIVSQFILPCLTAAGVTWIAQGTIDPTQPISLTVSGDTPRSLLQKICQTITPNPEYQLRRDGTSPSTTWYIDIRTQLGSDAAALDVRSGKNLTTVKRQRTTDKLATVVVPRGAVVDILHATMDGAAWEVTAIAGAVLTLADPAGGDGPIAFDNQLSAMGCYLRTVGGTLTQVTACAVATQTVTVASAAGITVGDLVEFRADSSGTRLTSLTAPAALGTYGRIVRILDRPDLPATINLLANAACRAYTNGAAPPDGWTTVRSPTTTKVTIPARWKSGGASCRLQTTSDGDGVDTPYAAIVPTAAKPYFSGFVTFWLDGGTGAQVRVEMIAATDPVSVTSLSFAAGTVTVTTGSAHALADGDLVEIAGASPDDYNGIFAVTVTDSTHFTYQIYTSPGAASGTITARQAWRFPQGTDARAWSNQLAAWDDLGIEGIDLHALGATWAKLRIVQDGLTAIDCYVDAAQLTQDATQQPFIETSGPQGLWQAANQYLRQYSQPIVTYDSGFLDLKTLLPATYPSDDVVVGGAVNLRDEECNFTATTRILEVVRKYLPTHEVAPTYSNRPDDLTDLLVRRPLPKLPTRGAVTTSIPVVLADIQDVPANPGQVQFRLASTPQGATIRYFIGSAGQLPPPMANFGTGTPTSTAWGTYTGAVTTAANLDVDTQLFAYCQLGNIVSSIQSWRIGRNGPAAVDLTLVESPAGTVLATWSANNQTRYVRVYLRKNGIGWPTLARTISGITRSGTTATVTTAAAHNLVTGMEVVIAGAAQSQYNGAFTVTVVDATTFTYLVSGSPTTPATGTISYTSPTGALDEAGCFIQQMHVAADGGGWTSAGAPIAGGTSYSTGSGYAAGDIARVVLVPLDRNGNPSIRASAKITTSGVVSPAISDGTVSRTTDGTGCDATSGASVTVGWDGTSATDGTHEVNAYWEVDGGGWNLGGTQTSPHSSPSRTFKIPFLRSASKFDPLRTFSFKAELVRVADGVVLSSISCGTFDMTSNCPS